MSPSLRNTVGPLPDDSSGRYADVMLEDVGPPGKGVEHIGELTDEVLQLLLLGSREVGVDVDNHGIRGGKGRQLSSSPDPPFQQVNVIELVFLSAPGLANSVGDRTNFLCHGIRSLPGGQKLAGGSRD